MFRHRSYKSVSVEEFNALLDYVRPIYEVVYDAPDCTRTMGRYAYVNEHQTKVELTFKKGTKVVTYVARLDGRYGDEPDVTGSDAFAIGQRYYKVPERQANFSAKPLLYYNPAYEYERMHAYAYDINSAYSTVMYNKRFPDTSVDPHDGIVTENEIGFNSDGDLVHEGKYAKAIFPLMESPYKRFVETWYNRKKNAKTKKERNNAKAVLNYYVGMLQRHNPYLRAFIVNSCSEFIRSHMDDYTLLSNTDSIISLHPLDLTIGEELGEWKYEEGEVAYIGHNYQWNMELPKYRGIPKGWFKEGFDILKDVTPSFGNVYHLDYNTLQVKEEFEVL